MTAEAVIGWQELSSPARSARTSLGTGYRATIEALSADQQDLLREQVVTDLAANEIAAIRTDVVCGTATRPA
jgi:hypothetical protein